MRVSNHIITPSDVLILSTNLLNPWAPLCNAPLFALPKRHELKRQELARHELTRVDMRHGLTPNDYIADMCIYIYIYIHIYIYIYIYDTN